MLLKQFVCKNKNKHGTEKLKIRVLDGFMKVTWHFWLVVFYNISTLVGYLKTNPVYTYILNIHDL